jgi:hypothetical protein
MSLTYPTLENIDIYLDELIDKQGSDYFPLPVKLDRFIALTYDFIRSNLVYMDATQPISDDIRTLIIESSDISIIKDSDSWKVPVPSNYHRLITIAPLIDGLKKSREVTILKNGQETYALNPFREPTPEYPNVFRMNDFFYIKTGKDNSVYTNAYLKYCKEPTFAKEGELEKRIVDLPIQSIIQICNQVSNSFRYTTSDNFAQQNEAFNAKFGKKNRS